MATLPVIQVKGLAPADNQLSAVPSGGLVEASNCIIRFRDVLEPRRGQKFLGQTDGSATAKEFGVDGDTSEAAAFFEGSLLIHYDGKLSKEDVGGFTDFAGAYEAHDGRRLRLLISGRSLYLNAADGLRVLEAIDGDVAQAGVAKPTLLAHVVPAVSTYERGPAGPHLDRTNCAYRAVWARLDAHGRLQVSAVSQRIVVRNDPLAIAIGGLVRAGSTVTATYTGSPAPVVGATVAIALPPGGTADANFAVGDKVVTGVGSGTFTYTEAGSAVASTEAYEAYLGARTNLVEVGMPEGLQADAFCMLYRSLFTDPAASAPLDLPDDELFQVAEVAVFSPLQAAAGAISYTAPTDTFATVAHVGHGLQEGQRIAFSPGDSNLPAGTVYTVLSIVDADTFTFNSGPYASNWTNAALQAISAAGSIVVTDRQPEELAGTPLYTNPNTGDGIGSSNERPPLAKDMCEWQERVWFLNTTDRHRFALQMLGVGSPDGVQSGDVLTIDGRTYTAGTTGATAAGYFLLESDGTPSQNVIATAHALCRAINLDEDARVTAVYESAENDTPGKIRLEEKEIGGAAFTVYASRPASWFPALTDSSVGAKESKNDRRRNGLSYSKMGQPEAVPLLNFLPVGADVEGLRVIPLRDKLFVFPEHGGIYTVSGAFPFRVDILDGTTWLLASESAVVHGNQIFALTNQGVVAISDSGVRVVSKGIEDELLDLTQHAPTLTKVRDLAFGVSLETERQYQLWLPEASDATCCTKAYAYNSLLNTWTPLEAARTWGLVEAASDTLYMGDGDANTVRVERRTGSTADYADEVLARTVVSASGAVVELDDVTGLEAGDLLRQSDAVSSHIDSIDTDAGTVTTRTEEAFAAGACTVLRAISHRVKGVPLVPSGPSILKQWREVTFHFRKLFGRAYSALFDTEKVPAESTAAFPTGRTEGYGMQPWGETPYGDEDNGARNVRIGIPREHADGTQLRVGFSVREAHSHWQMNGYSVEYEGGSERNSR